MPFEPHPTDPDKVIYRSRKYEGINMKTPEDEEFERIEREQKRIIETQEALREKLAHAGKAFDIAYDNLKRNEVLEEVAQEIEKFKGFGEDTIASFTVYIRNMKR
jgi:hypothetical protein